VILKDWGRLEEAMALHKQEEAICQELGDRAGLQRSYGNQAVILKDWGRLEEAMALLKKQEAICLELGDRAGLAHCHWSIALTLEQQGHMADARRRATASLGLFREMNMSRELAAVQELHQRLDAGSSV
jgi:hypothetical protein